MSDRISTAEAASRLGVKPETVYAYVSRGLLTSRRAVGQKGSTFDPAEIERFGRSRRSGRGRLDVPVASAITAVTDGSVSYRGRELSTLVSDGWTFEDVAELLWTGELEADPWTAPRVTKNAVRRALRGLPAEATPTQRMMAAVLAAGSSDPFRDERNAPGVARMGRELLSAFSAAWAALGSTLAAQDSSLVEVDLDRDASIAERLWYGLGGKGRKASPLVDCALTLVADHGLATSTLAARIAASTRAGPHAALLAALGAFSGPLHGAAGRRVHEMLADAEERGVSTAIAEAMRPNGNLPGVGHVIHKACDPRFDLLWQALDERALGGRRWSTAAAVHSSIERHSEAPLNIDFALGALTYSAGMSADSSEMIFAAGRTAGWLAHCIEEYTEAPLRFRAVGRYRAD